MRDYRKRRLIDATWVPLAADQTILQVGRFGFEGYREESLDADSIMLPIKYARRALEDRSFHHVHDTLPSVNGALYTEAQVGRDISSGLRGIHLVLKQTFDTGDVAIWQLNQDLVLALQLKQDGDQWVRPGEDYLVVARLHRKKDGAPSLLEFRAEHLRDYLNARKRGLLIKMFRSRREIAESFACITWPEERSSETFAHGMWEGYVTEVHEGGRPPFHVTVIRRTDVDPEDEVPVLEWPKGGDVAVESFVTRPSGRALHMVTGDLWTNHWIQPGPASPRIRGDFVQYAVPFVIDSAGTRAPASELVTQRRWLWFNPTLVPALLARPRGGIGWYSEDTGCLGGAQNRMVHFGMNSMGFINVFAKDIAELPEGHQRQWAAHNVAPEGKVCRELLAAQMECECPMSVAPEEEFAASVEGLIIASTDTMGESVLMAHATQDTILLSIHRFRALDMSGFCGLAKDMTRYVIERLDRKMLAAITKSKVAKLGSLKLLEMTLAQAGFDGHFIVAPLFGLNDLRNADAHLPPADLSRFLQSMGVENTGNYVLMAKAMIRAVAEAIRSIAGCISKMPPRS